MNGVKPSDDSLLWTRPPTQRALKTTLEQDWQRMFWSRAQDCYLVTGCSLLRAHHVRFVNGWQYQAADPRDDAAALQRAADDREREHAALARGTSLFREEVRLRVRELLVRQPTPRSRQVSVLVRHLEKTMETAAEAFGDLHWRGANGDQVDFPAVFADLTGAQPAEATPLLRGLNHATVKLVRRLRMLARIAQEDTSVRDVVNRADVTAARAHPVFGPALNSFLRVYGRRTGAGWGSYVRFTTPTWSMQPDIVLGMVAAYLQRDLDALDAADAQAKRERDVRLRRVRRALRNDPAKLERFEAAYRRAVFLAQDCEDSNHLIEQECLGAMREAVATVARRLVELGIIQDEWDVLHLSLDELKALGDDGPNMMAAVAERRSAMRDARRRPPPLALGSSSAGAPDATPAGASIFEDEATFLEGRVACPGRATGTARVARVSPDPPTIAPGEILVADDCGPAWTPVVPLAAAIVLDNGDPSQHIGIIAREFGVPTIVGTEVATRVVRNGDLLSLDASVGRVDIVARSACA